MIKSIYIPNYYDTISRYFSDMKYGKKYNDVNLTDPKIIRNIIIDLAKKKDYELMKHISLTIISDTPLLMEYIKDQGLYCDKFLYDIVKCSEICINDRYVINMTLYELIQMLIFSDSVADESIVNKLIDIAKLFPKEFFYMIPHVYNKCKQMKLYAYPAYENDRDDVLFINPIDDLTNTIDRMIENRYNSLYISKLLNITFRLKANQSLLSKNSEFYKTVLDKTPARITNIETLSSNNMRNFYSYVTCDLYTLKNIFKNWKLAAKLNEFSIAFMYYCLKDNTSIYNIIKLDDEEEKELLNYLVNENALNK